MIAEQETQVRHSSPAKSGVPAALGLAILAGLTSQHGFPGSVIALVPLGLLIFLLLTPRARPNLILAVICCGAIFAVFVAPGPINLTVAWLSLGALALHQQGHGFTNLTATAQELLWRVIARPQSDVAAVRQLQISGSAQFDLRILLLPVLSLVIFAGLLAVANPLIASVFQGVSLEPAVNFLWSWAPLTALFTFIAAGAILQAPPAKTHTGIGVDGAAPHWHSRYFSPFSVAITLAALNVLFFTQNAMDFSYLWQGEALPPGFTYAAYVHRGAYALIATALAAGALVIFALWPGTASEASVPVRALVYLWILQNVLLVISSVARTLSYVDAYGLTLLRTAGLVWMGLVALWLALIGLRIVLGRSNLWLVNRNILAAFATLWAVGIVDTAAIVANYNVEHALLRPQSEPLRFDYAYVQSLGPSAITALRRLDAELLARARSINPAYPKPLAGSDDVPMLALIKRQADWRSWTFRHAFIADAP